VVVELAVAGFEVADLEEVDFEEADFEVDLPVFVGVDTDQVELLLEEQELVE
jgi:hypothetical protein